MASIKEVFLKQETTKLIFESVNETKKVFDLQIKMKNF